MAEASVDCFMVGLMLFIVIMSIIWATDSMMRRFFFFEAVFILLAVFALFAACAHLPEAYVSLRDLPPITQESEQISKEKIDG